MSVTSLPTLESPDCFDGMIIYGISGNLEKYNECKRRLDAWLDEEEASLDKNE